MIRRCAFLNLSDGGAAEALAQVMKELRALVAWLEGCGGFRNGLNRDIAGKSQAYDDGFVFDAADADALQCYAENPTHQALGRGLVALCAGRADGIMVFDIDTGDQ